MNTRRHEAAAVAAILGLGIALAACANGAASDTPPPVAPAPGPVAVAPAAPPPVLPATPAAPPAAAPPVATSAESPEGDVHRHHSHGALTMLIAMSLADVNLTDDEKAAVEKLKGDFEAKMAPVKAAGKDLSGLLADEVAAGTVDRKKTDAAIDHLVTLVQAQQDASLDALNQLHAILTPPQRAALGDALLAHWEKWKAAQGHDEADDGKHHAGHLLGLVRDLGLSRQQAEQIQTSFRALMKSSPQEAEPAKARDHVQALAKTFKNDKFDAKTLKTVPSGGASMARWGSLRQARFLEAATPVLLPDQRTRLADMLRSRAM